MSPYNVHNMHARKLKWILISDSLLIGKLCWESVYKSSPKEWANLPCMRWNSLQNIIKWWSILIIDKLILKIDMVKSGLLKVNDLWLMHEIFDFDSFLNEVAIKFWRALSFPSLKILKVIFFKTYASFHTKPCSFLISPPSRKQIHAEKFKVFVVTQQKTLSRR